MDPSAASFIECILDIKESFGLSPQKIRYWKELNWCPCCFIPEDILLQKLRGRYPEFSLSVERKGAERSACKENDHAMDEIRYFAMEVFRQKEVDFVPLHGKGKQVVTERRRIDCRGGNGAGKEKKDSEEMGRGITLQRSRHGTDQGVGPFLSTGTGWHDG